MRFIIPLFFTFLLISVKCVAQDDNYKELFTDAEFSFYDDDYEEARYIYQQINKIDPENANISYRIGVCYLHSNIEKTKAIPYLEMATENLTQDYAEGSVKEKKAPLDALLFLGDSYFINNELDKAVEAYNKYKSLNKENNYETKEYLEIIRRKLETCEDAREIQQLSITHTKKCLEGAINTSLPELNPVLTGDGSTLAYTSIQKFYDGVYISELKDGKWSIPKNFNFDVRVDGDLRLLSISADGKTLYLLRDDLGIKNIYTSELIDAKWSGITKLDICTRADETHASESPDGNTLFFSSDRKGGLGGDDIYKAEKDASGKWGDPVNMGSVINTEFDDKAPYLLENGTTLFFCSQGHFNMGGLDAFVSKLGPDGNWLVPQNLGYPLNSTDDEESFFPVNKGRGGYIARSKDVCEGETDIFYYELDLSKGQSSVKVNGMLDIPADQVLKEDVRIDVYNTETDKQIETVKPDKEKGSFSVTLTAGKYKLNVMSGNQEKFSAEYTFPSVYYNAEVQYKKEIKDSDNMTEGQKAGSQENNDTQEKTAAATGEVTVSNVLFGFNKADTDKYYDNLNKLADYLKANPDAKIEIGGYADLQGDDAYNKQLSKRRAEFIKKYVVGKGASEKAIKAVGYGEKNQVSVDTNPETRKYNRRAEIKIKKQGSQTLVIQNIDIPEAYRIK